MPEVIFDLPYFRARVSALAERGVYVGTSSWNYQGWLGQVYTEERYEKNGRFIKKRFEEDCLREYAETFKTVCFDGAYYNFYGEEKWRAMAEQVPPDFKFGLKVPEAITVKRWPAVPKHGAKGGQVNPEFLNAPLFVDRFLGPLESIRPNVGPIIFEFSKLYPADLKMPQFLEQLEQFFAALPKTWSFSVELRNRDWLGEEYLALLKKHGIAHTLNNWTDMPAVKDQLEIVKDQVVEDLTVARFLLKPGRKYEEAVQKFSPYKITQEINEEARSALQLLIEKRWVRLSRNGTYIYINNRLEGNALNTVLAVLDRLDALKAIPRPAPPPPKPLKPSQAQFDLGL